MKKFIISTLLALAVIAPALSEQYHIKWGDTLTWISRDHGTTIPRVLELNTYVKNPDLIYAGKYLALDDRVHKTPVTENDNNTDGYYIAGRFGGSELQYRGNQYVYDVELDEIVSLTDGSSQNNQGLVFRAAIGYDFNPIRAEVEYMYGRGFTTDGEFELAYEPVAWEMRNQIQTVMANVYYDIDLGLKITPYIMAGIGWANIREDVSAGDTELDVLHDNNIALGAGAGISWQFTEKLAGEVGYRFVDLGSVKPDDSIDRDYLMQDITVGLRYQF